MPDLLSKLSKSDRDRLIEEMNYLNLEEIHVFCSARGIPYKVQAEYPDGRIKPTKDTDRKPIVLARIRRYLSTGDVGRTTRIPATIVREGEPPSRLRPRDRMYYRWYSREYPGVIRVLRELTDGAFRNGAVARVLAMEFWTRGKAPTFAEFARAWMKVQAEKGWLLTPEYAYLTDRQRGRADGDWKAVRKEKARSALATLTRIAPAQTAR